VKLPRFTKWFTALPALNQLQRLQVLNALSIHVQDVNAYHGRLREWLLPFHCVTSRSLPNYLG